MHESSLLTDLLRKIESVARENDSGRITRIRVKLGALSPISADHFCEHFNRAVKGTLADGAQLEIVRSTDISDVHAQDVVLESVQLAGK